MNFSMNIILNFFKYRGLSTNIPKMIGQKKISTFFQTKQQQKRRDMDDSDSIQDSKELPAPKKLKHEEASPSTPSPPSSPVPNPKDKSPSGSPALSPEQKSKVEQYQQSARLKLISKKTNGLVVNFGSSWLEALEPEFSKPYFEQLAKFVAEERTRHTVFPPAQDVFSFTRHIDLREVKVVILGQDPYHGPKQAHGLCFSVQKGVDCPPSLKNMYKEMAEDIDGFTHPGHGHLLGWAEQGVLLLNAVLTVRAHNANSHKDKGWEKVTTAIISWLNRNLDHLVFVLWGSYAQKKGAIIDQKKHHILKGVHPSPLSAHRGYFGSKHFSKCNDLLEAQGRKPIDWKNLP